jgi:hypothetical protein
MPNSWPEPELNQSPAPNISKTTLTREAKINKENAARDGFAFIESAAAKATTKMFKTKPTAAKVGSRSFD